MEMLHRRRFLSISAAVAGVTALGVETKAAPLYRWRGTALGAAASITLRHPEAERLVEAARAEIARLEAIFSLYRTDSMLMRLNARGRLDNPPFEMLDVLSVCDAVHIASNGLFDPTIQPLWEMYAVHYAEGRIPSEATITSVRERVGWQAVAMSSEVIAFKKKYMGLTLNGVAQGYIADRVAAVLEREGLTDVLVDTGELRAIGGHPDGGGWPVSFAEEDGVVSRPALRLRDRALASSAPLGTAFDAEGKVGHIINPLTGRTAATGWRLVSLTAPTAALADALSTAMCLMTRAEMDIAASRFSGARIVYLM